MGHRQDIPTQLRAAAVYSSSSSSSRPDAMTGDIQDIRPMTRQSRSDDEPSTVRGADSISIRRRSIDDDKSQSKTPRWLSHVKDWLAVSEPSAQAMKEQKRTMYKKHGVDPNDPQAAAKLHFPMGQVPEGATTSTRGPRPEKAYKKRVEREKELSRRPEAGKSVSSSISSAPSSKGTNPATPWDNW
jgi:hypothetical protein